VKEGGRWGNRGEKGRDEEVWTNKKLRMGIRIRGLEGIGREKGKMGGMDGVGQLSRGKT
jgi:hypothetical protein